MVLLSLPARARVQEPGLDTVLARAASYVSEIHQQLSGIVAEETYVQQIRYSNRGSSSRTLKSDLLLVKPPYSDRFIEFRDVFEVDGHAVRDRQERLTRLFLDPSSGIVRGRAIVEESARYNIGDIPRTLNTPMLTLAFLQHSYQRRFRFTRAKSRPPALAGLTVSSRGGPEGFLVSSEAWVIEFRETERGTVVRRRNGGDFPAAGRFWVDPASGAVLLSELVMNSNNVKALINVKYQPDALLGFRVPAEMREQYRDQGARVEGLASYGRFRQFQVRTDTTFGAPDDIQVKPPAKPPGADE